MSDPVDTLPRPSSNDETAAPAGWLQSLNPEQREACMTTEGPLLVLAGAGTGKTKVLTSRIAYILQQGLAFPSQILGVTFTNKAAREMKERIEQLVGPALASGLWLGTFHSIGVRILRRHAALLNIPENFTILDADDQLRLTKAVLESLNIDDKRWPAKLCLALIQQCKDRALAPSESRDVATHVADGKFKDVYATYQARLTQLGAMDFGDLIFRMIELFRAHPDVLAEYQRRFRYLLVDEYQDTNAAQYLWLKMLSQQSQNICCVGDDDQSIYGWRGAEVENILRFEKDFSGATVLRLEQNYRSTSPILAAAGALIANNKGRFGKELWTEQNEGAPVQLVSLWDEHTEARYVAESIQTSVRQHDLSYREIAILVRAGFQTRAFEEALLSAGIAYSVIGGLRFYERQEIRDAVAYIRATMQPQDDLALLRIINLPKRGLGAATLEQIGHQAAEWGVPLQAAILKMLDQGAFKPKVAIALSQLMQQFARWRVALTEARIPHAELVLQMLKESGYIAMWQQEKTSEAEGRVDNLHELISALEEFESLDQFLEHISLVLEGDDATNKEKVSVMTMHSAKGLEFAHVFLTGWEEGLFPSQRSIEEKGIAGLEEERRLAYVGITRARKHLTICFAANRRIYNQWTSSIPSRFIDELPEAHIERLQLTHLGPSYRNNTRNSSPLSDKKLGGTSIASSTSVTPPQSHSNPSGFAIGQRVFNIKYGYGRLLMVQDKHCVVAFEKAGTKTVLSDYLSAGTKPV